MEWVLDNWFLLLFGGGMIAMHMFGHGGHGKSGGKGGHACCKSRTSKAEQDGKPDAEPVAGDSRGGDAAGSTVKRNDT